MGKKNVFKDVAKEKDSNQRTERNMQIFLT